MQIKRKTVCNHFTVFQVEFLATENTSHLRCVLGRLQCREIKSLKKGVSLPSGFYLDHRHYSSAVYSILCISNL